ncbi:MAG: hypothetical protein WA773_04115 [Bradyrhizobium sp.]|jgi:hypothetical protein
MNRPPADIDPRALAADFFRKLGGMEGMTKWGKSHRSLAYQLIAKLMAQPQVVNNVNVANVAVADESARRKLEDAFLRLIDARKHHDGDHAVYVDGERLRDDGRIIEHQPRETDAAPRLSATAVDGEAPDSNSENLKSPNQGPLFSRGGVATTPGGSTPAGGKNKISNYPNPLSGGFAVALDGLDDHLSTTERFLLWKGHGGPP